MKLSPRLLAIAEMIDGGKRVADIGTDHALLPIYLLKTGKASFSVCSDIKKGPLLSAEKNIRLYGLTDKTRLELADGLNGIRPNEADIAVIAGMGGEMISHILSDFVPEGLEEFILQPMRNIPSLRKTLHTLGYRILKEKLVKEKTKMYIIIHAKKGIEPLWSEEEYIVSPLLKKDVLWEEYSNQEIRKIDRALSQLSAGENDGQMESFIKLKELYKK